MYLDLDIFSCTWTCFLYLYVYLYLNLKYLKNTKYIKVQTSTLYLIKSYTVYRLYWTLCWYYWVNTYIECYDIVLWYRIKEHNCIVFSQLVTCYSRYCLDRARHVYFLSRSTLHSFTLYLKNVQVLGLELKYNRLYMDPTLHSEHM